MSSPIYIHYGHDSLDPDLLAPIRNIRYFTKPSGGLWASRESASFGWKQWCEEETYERTDFNKSFRFIFKPEARVYCVSTLEDLYALPCVYDKDTFVDHQIDFEQCLANGIDAIELCWYGDEWSDIRGGDLYMEMYGWDCDSVIVMNVDAIEILSPHILPSL